MGLLIHDEGSTTAGFISEYKVLATADHKPLRVLASDLRVQYIQLLRVVN